MKRIICGVLIVLVTAGFAFAQQGWGGHPRQRGDRREWPAPEKVSLSGKLGLSRGFITLESGDTRYYAAGLERWVGFIDGLKVGADVSVEGYVFSVPQNEEIKMLRVTKLRLGGQDYELSPLEEREYGNFPGPMMDRYDWDRSFHPRGQGHPGGRGPWQRGGRVY
jgi:hypothetical protein